MVGSEASPPHATPRSTYPQVEWNLERSLMEYASNEWHWKMGTLEQWTQC